MNFMDFHITGANNRGSALILVIVVSSILLSMTVSILYIVSYENRVQEVHSDYLNAYEMAVSGIEIMIGQMEKVIDQNRRDIEADIINQITSYPVSKITYYKYEGNQYEGEYHLKLPDTSLTGKKDSLYYELYNKKVSKIIADNFSAPINTVINDYSIKTYITENYEYTYTIVSEAKKGKVTEKVSAKVIIDHGDEIIEEDYFIKDDFVLLPDWENLSKLTDGVIVCEEFDIGGIENDNPVIVVNPKESILRISDYAEDPGTFYGIILSKGGIEIKTPLHVKGDVFTEGDITGEALNIEKHNAFNDIKFEDIIQKRKILSFLGIINFPDDEFHISKITIEGLNFKLISIKKIG